MSVIENLEEYIDDMEGLSGLSSESYMITKSATTVDRGTGIAIYNYTSNHQNHYDINNTYESEETNRSIDIVQSDHKRVFKPKL